MATEPVTIMHALGAGGTVLGSIAIDEADQTYVVDCRRCERVITRQRLIDAIQWIESHTHGAQP